MSLPLVFIVGAAFAASLTHQFIDLFIGLYGSGRAMSVAQALFLLILAALYGWWAALFAGTARGDQGAATAQLLLCAVWVTFGNGIGGLVGCPIPCANAFPYQDVAHLGNIGLGAGASVALWRAYGTGLALRTRFGATFLAFAVALVAAGALVASR